ncbi:MAG: chloramphenicol phosphotransferase [Pseudomonadota bacterium]
MSGKVIFLHGASSSGKSSIARALQNVVSEPFWHISIDHLRDSGVLPSARFQSGEFDWRRARPAFFEGFHRSLGAYTSAGNNLILEHILDNEGFLGDLAEAFSDTDVFTVGVFCPPELLAKRELARGDRPAGSALRDAQTIHEGRAYDLSVDGTDPPEENATRIAEAWSARRSPLAFSRRLKAAQ